MTSTITPPTAPPAAAPTAPPAAAPSAPPAGWYTDSTGPGTHYWDGAQWGEPESTLHGILSRGSARWAAALTAARAQPWWQRGWLITAGAALVLLLVLALALSMSGGSTPVRHAPNHGESAKSASAAAGSAAAGHHHAKASNGRVTRDTSPDVTSAPTTGRAGALASAGAYLSSASFSRPGLVGQLQFDGYTMKEALYAANKVGANWNRQAVKSAKDDLSLSTFTREALIAELEFEGFTWEQAVYGVSKSGF